ncbi:thioredoxin reductase/SAM-dependent methyltransferase [Rhodococcus sp. PvR044]|nr:thioredoxin reductase/protein-L-isoaspartate O-methyltransferase [Rhodococcus sp. PvR099]
MEKKYDVVIVGGGAAGLSGAVALARARRSVLVIDAGEPRNAPAAHAHNYLTREGTPPAELLAAGRAEAQGYGADFVSGTVSSARAADGEGFRVELADGAGVSARRLLVATGLVDELPDVPGVAERWGREVLHCPYCHGWEVRDRAIGILATGPMAVHQALMWRQWSADITVFLHTAAEPGAEELEQFDARGIVVVRGEVACLEVDDDRFTGVRLRTGELVSRDAIVVAPRFEARAGFLGELGLEPTEQEMAGHVIGSYIAADPMGATAVKGVWAAGNVSDLKAQVIVAAAAGLNAGAAINADLIAEDTRLAVTAHAHSEDPAPGGPMNGFDERAWEERYRSRSGVWSGSPNPHLVTEAAELTPGTALDVGAGEGADAHWLAERGWRVTAVDFSTTALERAAARAEALGADVVHRLNWVHADLTAEPVEGRFDLVTAHFMHLPEPQRTVLYARLAAAVAPGGSLLIVGHHPSDLQTTVPRPPVPELFFTAEELAGSLDPDKWDIVAAEARARTTTDPDGREVTIHDAVLRARRRP